jgi:two-component system, sensor histidine kinase RpfC
MGGTIGVISSPGKGSKFWFELPLREPVPDSEEAAWGPRRNVLVVGRHSPDLGEITATLNLLGLEPVQGGGVPARVHEQMRREGTRYLAAVLVADQFDTEKFVREMIGEQGGRCPWIVVTRYASALQGTAPFQLGCTSVFGMPIDAGALELALKSLVSRLDIPDLGRTSESVAESARPLKVLLADDNPSNQLLMSRILTGAGHSVICAERGDQAFDLMAKETLDAAILDLNMPDMSGPDVVKLFRASSVGADRLPIIILSADATPAAKQESLEAGADDFLTKPVIASNLFAALDRLVAGAGGSGAQGVVQPVVSMGRDAEPASTTPIMVDSERIQALRRIARGDESFLDKYLSAAFSEIEQATSDLRTAVAENDVRAARNALHIIEGTGASVGANALVDNCKAMRNYLGAGQDSDSAHALADLSAAYALAKSVILANVHNARENASRSDTSN